MGEVSFEMPIRVYSRESSALSSRFFSGLSSAVCSRLFSVVFEVVLQVVLRCIRVYPPGCSPLYSRLSSVVFRVVLQVVLNGLPGCPPDYPGCPLGFPMVVLQVILHVFFWIVRVILRIFWCSSRFLQECSPGCPSWYISPWVSSIGILLWFLLGVLQNAHCGALLGVL